MIIKYNNHLLVKTGLGCIGLTKQYGTFYAIHDQGMSIGYMKKSQCSTIRFNNRSDRVFYIGTIILDIDKYEEFVKSILFIMYNYYYDH